MRPFIGRARIAGCDRRNDAIAGVLDRGDNGHSGDAGRTQHTPAQCICHLAVSRAGNRKAHCSRRLRKRVRWSRASAATSLSAGGSNRQSAGCPIPEQLSLKSLSARQRPGLCSRPSWRPYLAAAITASTFAICRRCLILLPRYTAQRLLQAASADPRDHYWLLPAHRDIRRSRSLQIGLRRRGRLHVIRVSASIPLP